MRRKGPNYTYAGVTIMCPTLMKHLTLDGTFLDVGWVDGVFGVSLGLADTYTSVNFYIVGNI